MLFDIITLYLIILHAIFRMITLILVRLNITFNIITLHLIILNIIILQLNIIIHNIRVRNNAIIIIALALAQRLFAAFCKIPLFAGSVHR